MGEEIADRIRLELFRWNWWHTALVAVGAGIGVLAGALWGRA
ncbi:hypothetical protein V2W30_09175 [Streptomyces sp. Q6]|uniref:Uncharacterized protein n=1 Tax=Streptomyces citrinus TaxID=3118173 RepID=A0ACD5A8F9_9ACTN